MLGIVATRSRTFFCRSIRVKLGSLSTARIADASAITASRVEFFARALNTRKSLYRWTAHFTSWYAKNAKPPGAPPSGCTKVAPLVLYTGNLLQNSTTCWQFSASKFQFARPRLSSARAVSQRWSQMGHSARSKPSCQPRSRPSCESHTSRLQLFLRFLCRRVRPVVHNHATAMYKAKCLVLRTVDNAWLGRKSRAINFSPTVNGREYTHQAVS